MKNFLLLLFICTVLITDVLAQCDSPELISWEYPDANTLVIEFTASEDLISYEIELNVLMMDNVPELPDPYYLTGETEEGLNTVTITLDETVQPFGHQYSSVIITGICESESNTSDLFYVSDMSMLNDGICPEVEILNSFLPDGVGISFDSSFDVPVSNPPLQIDQFSVFVDITHSYLGDLNITLTSPAGTVVTLMEYPNSFGGRSNMSVLFEDGALPLELTELPDGFETLRGVHAPSESFEAFENEILSGTWTISVIDNLAADWGVLCGTCLIVEASECETSTQGKIYFDINGNGEQDEDELPLAYNLLSTSQDNSLMTNGQGEFINCFEAGSLDFHPVNTPLYYELAPENYLLELEEGDFLEGLDFTLTPIPGMNDLVVEVYSSIPDVPGFERTYYVSCTNVGTECIDDIVLSFTSPENTELLLVNGLVDPITSSQEFTLDLGTLCPQEATVTFAELMLSESLEVGIIHSYEASLESSETDETPENNIYSLETEVVSSYDPNDKTVDYEVVYENFIAEQKRLTYTVRFQNDGTFYAQNVVITDVIEEGLILESFELLESSHDVIPEFDGRELKLNFNNIQLPQSDLGLEESQGYVRFSFQPTEGFSLGETVENSAAIYFDFNEPIITNTAVTLYDEEEIIDSVTEVEFDGWVVYPNPVNSLLTIKSHEKILSAKLLNVSGQMVVDRKINSFYFELNTEKLSEGIYTLVVENSTGTAMRRVVKN